MSTRANTTKFDTRVDEAENSLRAGTCNRQLNQSHFDAPASIALSGGGIDPALHDPDNNVGVIIMHKEHGLHA